MKIARVVWHDIYVREEWHAKLKGKPMRMETIGRVHETTKEGVPYLVVVPNQYLEKKNAEEKYFGDVHIPRGCIESITYLKPG